MKLIVPMSDDVICRWCSKRFKWRNGAEDYDEMCVSCEKTAPWDFERLCFMKDCERWMWFRLLEPKQPDWVQELLGYTLKMEKCGGGGIELRTAEIAALMRVSRRTVTGWLSRCDETYLRAERIGRGRFRFRASKAFLEADARPWREWELEFTKKIALRSGDDATVELCTRALAGDRKADAFLAEDCY